MHLIARLGRGAGGAALERHLWVAANHVVIGSEEAIDTEHRCRLNRAQIAWKTIFVIAAVSAATLDANALGWLKEWRELRLIFSTTQKH